MNSQQFGSLFTPDYSHLTGLVQHLNSEELKSILNSEDKANELISDLKQVRFLLLINIMQLNPQNSIYHLQF